MAEEAGAVAPVMWEVFKRATLSGPLIDLSEKAIRSSEQAAASSNIQTLRDETERQELRARMAQLAARTQQEIAIARRIETAEEVEIEEFYEAAGSGALGIAAKEGALTVGASGDGSKVTRRVYRFKGVSGT